MILAEHMGEDLLHLWRNGGRKAHALPLSVSSAFRRKSPKELENVRKKA